MEVTQAGCGAAEVVRAVSCGHEQPGRVRVVGDPVALLARDFDALHATVYRYLLHRSFDPELAEELTAQTFCRAVGRVRQQLRDQSKLSLWLLRIATNVANAHYRKQRARQLLLGRFGGGAGSVAPTVATGQNGATRVRTMVATMRPKYQSVIAMRFYSRMPYDQIATVLGLSHDAVRARLSRAIKELRGRLGVVPAKSTG